MTFDEFLSAVAEHEGKVAAEGGELWYRGESNPDWKLRSSLHREILQRIPDFATTFSAAEQEEELRELAKGYYHSYRNAAWSLLEQHERSKWGLVFSMQHHGVPTRLLDWTKNLATALYFAVADAQPDKPVVVYVLDPEGLNYEVQGERGARGLVAVPDDVDQTTTDIWPYHPGSVKAAPGLPPMALAPIWSNPRMVAQQSTFILAGDSFQPLDEAFPSCIWRFVLEPSALPEVQRFLKRAGVDRTRVFPDLQSIAQWVRERAQ